MRADDPTVTRPENNKLPTELSRRYEVLLEPRAESDVVQVRDIRADCIGSLIKFKVGSEHIRRFHYIIIGCTHIIVGIMYIVLVSKLDIIRAPLRKI